MQQANVIKAVKQPFHLTEISADSESLKQIYRGFARAQAMIKTVIATCDASGHEDKDDEITYVVTSLIAADYLLVDTIRRTEAKKLSNLDDTIEGIAYSVAGILHVASKVMWEECDGTESTAHLVYGHQVLETAEEMLNDHAEMVGEKLRSAA